MLFALAKYDKEKPKVFFLCVYEINRGRPRERDREREREKERERERRRERWREREERGWREKEGERERGGGIFSQIITVYVSRHL